MFCFQDEVETDYDRALRVAATARLDPSREYQTEESGSAGNYSVDPAARNAQERETNK